MQKQNGFETKYDERQLAARGRAWQSAYIVLLVSLLAYVCADAAFGAWCEVAAGVGICACISAAVFAVHCICNDAYARLNEHPRSVIGVVGGITLLNLLLSIANIACGEMVENGVLTFHAANMAVGIMGAVILIAYLIRLRIARKEGAEE